MIREHVTHELENYVRFFNRFDVDPLAAEDVLAEDKRDFINSIHYDVFLKVNLTVDETENEIKFENELSEIRSDILLIFDDIVKLTHHIARPENSLIRCEE